jgi:hypothetical protein
MFRKTKNVFYTDSFSAKSFVSHNTNVKKDKLPEIDLLPKIRNKLFLTPELSPTFTKRDDDLIEILGILGRILDGLGYESDTGAHGHRGYHGEYMFTWIGCAVDIPFKVQKFLSNIGAKLYFLRLPHLDKTEDNYLDDIDKDNYHEKTGTIKDALYDYLDYFDKYPEAIDENNIVKIAWDNNKDDETTKRIIIRLARLLGHLRGTVPVSYSEGTQGINYAYALPTIEEPDRAITQLRNLARGHALSQGRNFIAMGDIPLVIKVVLSTASKERVRVFELLIASKGTLTVSRIVESLKMSEPTAKRTMAEFNALGIADLIESESEQGTLKYECRLVESLNWFLEPEFTYLKDDLSHKKITPTDMKIIVIIIMICIRVGVFFLTA